MSDLYKDIGDRLKAYRLGSNLAPEVIAENIGISRAALYRYEKGAAPKINTLEKISSILGVSLASLLGVEIEYLPSCISFLERMRQIELDTRHISTLFGSISYLLTSDAYDNILHDVLTEGMLNNLSKRKANITETDAIINILRSRKETYRERKPNILSLIAISDLERFTHYGFIGNYNLPKSLVKARKMVALQEVNHIINLLESEPIGVQLGVLNESSPHTAFQIFRQPTRDLLAISPFRFGELPNTQLGVAMISSAPEAVKLHSNLTEELWDSSLKGYQAIDYIRKIL